MKILKYICLAGVLLSTWACDSYLDQEPENTLTEQQVFSKLETSESYLLGAYADLSEGLLGKSGIFSYGAIYGDLTTNNVTLKPATYIEMVDAVTPVDDQTVQELWQYNFKAVNTANLVIARVPEYATYSDKEQKRIVAEARFIRAFAYFNLLRHFGDQALTKNPNGLGLPLQTAPYEGYDLNNLLKRSTNEETFQLIFDDLQKAFPDAPETFPAMNHRHGRGTQYAVKALEAKVALAYGDLKRASDAAEAAMSNTSNYGLENKIKTVFPIVPEDQFIPVDLSKEVLFGLPVSANGGTNFQSGNVVGNINNGNTFWVSDELANLYEAGDERKTVMLQSGSSVSSVKVSAKFVNTDGRDNVPIIRLPEMMLIKAEYLASLSIDGTAISLLNEIRSRAGASTYQKSDFASNGDLLKAIYKERRLEFFMENVYRWDCIRLGFDLKNASLPENKKLLPIPKREIDVSEGSLVQNPGYL